MAKDVTLKIKVSDEEVVKASKSVKNLETAAAKVGKSSDGFDSLRDSVSGLSDVTNPATAIVAGLGAALAVGTAIAVRASQEIFALARSFAEYGTQVVNARIATGLSSEAISALKFQSQKLGIEFNSVVEGIQNFTKNIAEAEKGSKSAKSTLERLGIDSNTASKNIDQAFQKTIQTILKLPEGLQQATAAQDAFGSSGLKLLPFLKNFDGDMAKLIQQAGDYGFVMDDKAIRASKEFDEALKDSRISVDGLKLEIGRQFLPVVAKLFSDINGWLKENRAEVKETISVIVQGVKNAIENLKLLVALLKTAALSYQQGFLNTSPLQAYSINAQNSLQDERNRDQQDRAENLGLSPSASQLDKFVGNNAAQSYLRDIETARKQAESLRKEREQLARAELSAQIGIYSSQLKEVEKIYAETFDKISETFRQTGDIAGFQNTFDNLKAWYGNQINSLVPLWETLVEKQTLTEKKGNFQRVEIYNQTQKRKLELENATNEKIDAAEKLISDIRNKRSKEEISALKEKAEIEAKFARMRKEELFAEIDASENSYIRLEQIFTNKIELGNKEIENIEALARIEREVLVENQSRKLELLRVELDLRNKIHEIVKNTPEGTAAGIAVDEARSAIKIAEALNKVELFKFDQDKLTEISQIQQSALKDYESFRSALENQLTQVKLNNRELTVYEQILKDIEENYQHLSQDKKDYLLGLASEIDALKQIKQEYSELKNSLKEIFGFLFDGDIKGLFQSFADKAKDVFIDRISGIFATQILGFDPNKTDNPVAKPIVKEITASNKLLQNIDKNIANSTGGTQSIGGGFGSFGGILQTVLGGIGGSSSSTIGHEAGHLGGQPGQAGGSGFNLLSLLGLGGSGSSSGGSGGGFLGNIKNIFSSKNGGLFGAGGLFGEEGFGNNVGTYNAVGSIASLIGGFIGGKFGSVLGGIGTGISTGATIGSALFPGVGTAVGAVVGGLVGFFSTIFGSKKQKIDKNENLPKLQEGFVEALKQLREIAADKNAILRDPQGSIDKATAIRAEIAGGFGISFQSKKYRRIAQQQIAQRTIEATRIIDDIKAIANIGFTAKDLEGRIIPEFADGGAVSNFFRKNFSGLVPGKYDRRDDKLIAVSGNEVVLTPDQWRPITPYLKQKRVPGFRDGGFVSARPRVQSSENSPMNITLVFEHSIDSNGMVKTSLKNPEVQKQISITIEDKFKNGELKLKKR